MYATFTFANLRCNYQSRLSGYILFPMLLLTTHFGGAWSHWGAKNAPYGTRLVAYTIAPAIILASVYARVR